MEPLVCERARSYRPSKFDDGVKLGWALPEDGLDGVPR